MVFFNAFVFALLLVSAVLPEFISGVDSSSLPNGGNSFSNVARQVSGCSGRCFRRVVRARQDCRIGINAGNVCRLQRCENGFPNPGFQCILIAPPPPSDMVPPVTCPDRCFIPGIPMTSAVEAARASAVSDCNGSAPCFVQGCLGNGIIGFACKAPNICPNVCSFNPVDAQRACQNLSRYCTVVTCLSPGGTMSSACVPIPTPAPLSPIPSTASPSPSMSPGASPSVTPSITPSPLASSSTSPTPSTTVSPTPSPGCSFASTTVGTTAATGTCTCGTSTSTVSIPGFVDDAGMALSVQNEIPGGTAYTTCLARDLPAACNPNGFSSFSAAARTAAVNCCTGSVVDGMGLNTATNQCRIGDGCGAVMIPDATSLIMAAMATCTCTSMAAVDATIRMFTNNDNTPITDLNTAGLVDALNAYRTCLVDGLAPLCSSNGVATFNTAAMAVVDACCDANRGMNGMGTMGSVSAGNCGFMM